jgi:hypothetical protein
LQESFSSSSEFGLQNLSVDVNFTTDPSTNQNILKKDTSIHVLGFINLFYDVSYSY